ncbi:septum formation initiator family protein [Glutamicibacter protophormiae]|uniref:FtsB family cell division protein n=1 Tax=Glutamicibacter protophormiae TaxID=37930 RepID=UPI002A7F38A2|nr:septum formation initiator family protein [Glutamicibacter protophormiae]WPR65481.1 septum formation initiator family protein [Glutamicibacter protophormiae]WPR68979.1 septum formation initiator family protein [Glutamicibacter protophormiae]
MAQRPPRMPRRNTPSPGQDKPQEFPENANRASADPAPAHEAEPATDSLHIVRDPEPPASQPKVRKLPSVPQTHSKPAASAAGSGRTGGPKPPNSKPAGGATAAQAGRRAKPEEPGTPVPQRAAHAEGSKRPLRERAKEKQNERRREDRAKFSMAVRRKPGEKPAPQAPVQQGEPVAAHRFSGRIAALIVVFAFFAVMLVPTVNYYRTQMAQINELRASIAAMEAQRDELKAEIARWDDPLYIKQQARERINLVMPGEKLYMVVGEKPADESAESGNGSTYEVRQELPWVDALIDSITRSATD